MARLLIVDDEDQVRGSLRRVLERRGHSVQEATSVAEARDRLAAESFELVLCDINLAGESGLALVRQVAAELPDTAVVMVTGVDDRQVADEASAIGAYGYLVKPVLPNEVLINVDSGLRRRDLEKDRRTQVEELESRVLSRSTALSLALKRLEESETGAALAERETVELLVTALTLRNEETRGHIERMSRLCGRPRRQAGDPRLDQRRVPRRGDAPRRREDRHTRRHPAQARAAHHGGVRRSTSSPRSGGQSARRRRVASPAVGGPHRPYPP
jgi:putative two-component system response regulator